VLFRHHQTKMMDGPITNNREDVLLEDVIKWITDLCLLAW
jgi:hypothetical protein